MEEWEDQILNIVFVRCKVEIDYGMGETKMQDWIVEIQQDGNRVGILED